MAAVTTATKPVRASSSIATPLQVGLASLESLESVDDVIVAVGRLEACGALDLPLPGSGDTEERFRALSELGAVDLSLARLAEGHLDAIAILGEARRAKRPGLYGVWAADANDAELRAEKTSQGWRLFGRKRYASGATGLSRALVTARVQSAGAIAGEAPRRRLFDVDLESIDVKPVPGTWLAVGMAATGSLDVEFDGVIVRESAAVGGSDFYLSRPGFWHGGVGVAACWYGGALGAYRMLRRHLMGRGADDHQAAHLGAALAGCECMRIALDRAARAIDADPEDEAKGARRRALLVRHIVEQGCTEVLAHVARASGTSPLVFDRAHARRAADLPVYLRQHHAERDVAALGRAAMEREEHEFSCV